ncbi:MAG: TRAP transporter small permease subunit [Desulfobacterales bacterium]|jgi:TRAP-type mannitol/chloroaromatic compound transport system permease small subunit
MTDKNLESPSPASGPEFTSGGVMPSALRKMIRFIDTISIWTGKAVGWMIFPMIFSLVFEVVARYFFNAPTIWANDVATILYGAFFMLGSAYALQRQQHIRTDWLYEKWSIRTRGVVDSVCYIFLYFPGLLIFLWVGYNYAFRSTMLQERIVSSPWMPPIYPLKICIPIATLLLLIQGVSELIKSFYAATTGLDLHEETEGVET